MARGKAPRPKTDADKRYNERRRAKRAVSKLRKLADQQTGKARKQTLTQIANLMEGINQSYAVQKANAFTKTVNSKLNIGRKAYNFNLGYLDTLTARAQTFNKNVNDRLSKNTRTAEDNARLSKMQENYFRSASRTSEQLQVGDKLTNEQKLARAEASFFYSKTRNLWLSGSPELRNENILDKMKNVRLNDGTRVQNLQDAVQWVKENYEAEYPTMDDVRKGKYDTEQDVAFQEEEEMEDGSPDPVSYGEFRAAGVVF